MADTTWSPGEPSSYEIAEAEEERQKRAKGLFFFGILSLLSTAAFICGLLAIPGCDFVTREIIYEDNFNVSEACAALDFDETIVEDVCNSFFSNHSIGFYGWYATIPVDQQICLDYTLPIPGVGYVEPEFDTKFNAAKAFAITAIVMGAFAWFTIAMSSCCKLDQEQFKGVAGYFMLACFFQGLSLIIFRSDVCSVEFFNSYYPDNDEAQRGIDDVEKNYVSAVSCGLSRGSKLAISATVLYFVCNSIAPFCIVPDPITMRRSEPDNNNGNDNNTNRAAPTTATPPPGEDQGRPPPDADFEGT